MAHEVLKQ